jgi:penicillin-binding protein-related factor A (putative recombinase)
MNRKLTESAIQKSILDYLRMRQIFCWRNNSGARKFDYRRKDGNVTHNFFQWGRVGSGDIIGVLPGGKFFSIEVKLPGKKPTIEQVQFMDLVGKNKGISFVANSIDDVTRNLFTGSH